MKLGKVRQMNLQTVGQVFIDALHSISAHELRRNRNLRHKALVVAKLLGKAEAVMLIFHSKKSEA